MSGTKKNSFAVPGTLPVGPDKCKRYPCHRSQYHNVTVPPLPWKRELLEAPVGTRFGFTVHSSIRMFLTSTDST